MRELKINPKKISKSSTESNICLSCGECCKRYYITVLPNEAKKISTKLRISQKKFLEEYCELNVKLYPKSTPGVLTFSSSFFPKRVIDLIQKSFVVGDSYFVVPQIVLKRIKKRERVRTKDKIVSGTKLNCVFLEENNCCKIYSTRPTPCKLFPFIVMSDFREQYPFCELYKQTRRDYSSESKKYFSLIQKYFRLVDKKSFKSVWGNPPNKGKLFFADNLIGELTLRELEEMMVK